ncbi:MAG: winged helix-turn-helix transcriptional regulator [Archaeoglobus sp.]|nr:winged helix-turn-helix transcriptional regulator [Archaeoglobus sp.]
MGKLRAFTTSLLSLIIFCSLIASASAATIHGKVFSWETLEPVSAIVEINTTPAQKMVAKNGSYSFEVPPGVYKLKAYVMGSDLFAEENITIVKEGNYVIDLVLFPQIEYPELEDINKVEFPVDEGEGVNYYIYLIPLAVGGIVLLFYLRTRTPQTVEFQEEKAPDLPEDLKEIVDILVKEGGRISQRELRKKLGYSEAKVSLMIADLERRGIVEKVKKGRGNILFLRDEFIR